MFELYFILYALIFAKLSCYLAASKNRNKDLWYLAGFLGGFVVALILLYLPDNEPIDEENYLSNRFDVSL